MFATNVGFLKSIKFRMGTPTRGNESPRNALQPPTKTRCFPGSPSGEELEPFSRLTMFSGDPSDSGGPSPIEQETHSPSLPSIHFFDKIFILPKTWQMTSPPNGSYTGQRTHPLKANARKLMKGPCIACQVPRMFLGDQSTGQPLGG